MQYNQLQSGLSKNFNDRAVDWFSYVFEIFVVPYRIAGESARSGFWLFRVPKVLLQQVHVFQIGFKGEVEQVAQQRDRADGRVDADIQ